MRKILAFLLFVNGYCVYGQTLEDKHHRVLVLLDASLSMNEPVEGYATKYAAASDFIIRLMDSIYQRNDEVEFGLRVYGHQYPASTRQCFDTKIEVQFSRDNIEQMKMRLADVKPRGISNTYTALKEALEYDISSTNNYVYHILIITDGDEACSGQDIYSLSGLLKYKKLGTPCIALLNDKKTFACYTGSTKQLTKENADTVKSCLIHGCLIIPERHTKQGLSKEAVLAETKSILQIDNITQLKQSSDKQLSVTNTLASNTKTITVPSTTETKKGIGYLKITGVTGNVIIQLYEETNGVYKFYKKLDLNDKNINQRIALPEGKYQLVYKNITTKVFIFASMISEKSY